MKVSEKTLELNIGAELLALLRRQPRCAKAYLRGLTQAEERSEGVDFFAQLHRSTKLFAFQFKAPKGKSEAEPYKYTLVRYQHDPLFTLAQSAPGSVYYVFPYFVSPTKVHSRSPTLLSATWFLDVARMPSSAVFGKFATRTVSCAAGAAKVNPEYALVGGPEWHSSNDSGITPEAFASWYQQFRLAGRDGDPGHGRRNPWLVRGLRLAIAVP